MILLDLLAVEEIDGGFGAEVVRANMVETEVVDSNVQSVIEMEIVEKIVTVVCGTCRLPGI